MNPIKPFGEQINDGVVQMSFTLPVAQEYAEAAAKAIVLKMGFSGCAVVHQKDLDDANTFIVVVGTGLKHSVELEQTKKTFRLNIDGCREYLAKRRAKLGRPLRFIGGCLGTEIHSIGLDSIMQMKGVNGSPGLESYEHVETLNLGIQSSPSILLKRAKEWKADVILASVTVSHNDHHLVQLSRLIEISRAWELRDNFCFIAGGMSVSHDIAKKLGYDLGFGKGANAEKLIVNLIECFVQRTENKINLRTNGARTNANNYSSAF